MANFESTFILMLLIFSLMCNFKAFMCLKVISAANVGFMLLAESVNLGIICVVSEYCLFCI